MSNIDNDPNVVEPPEPKSYAEIRNARRLSANKAAPNQAPPLPPQRQPSSTRSNSNKRVSRFRVPTFEIRRTSSALAPCDMYNDIFDDFGAGSKPTIKAEGMKTLPSMDKDDVKRILNTKKGVTQDEYINAKLVDQKPKKNSIVTDPKTDMKNYNKLPLYTMPPLIQVFMADQTPFLPTCCLILVMN